MSMPPEDRIPEQPHLGAAAEHRAAAENAAQQRDFDRALRERFRAVLRGMEQRGVLDVRRSRTARETPDEASTAIAPELADELRPAASSFDEVVYGGRPATEDEYRRLEYADRYSAAAPPPAPEPVDTDFVEKPPRAQRRPLELPELLRNPKFWAAVLGVLVLGLLLWAMLQSCGAPNAPTPPKPPPIPTQTPPTKSPTSEPDDSDFGKGSDSIFERLPGPVVFGGLQFLIAAGLLAWWRGRRRGALVAEPRPVEVAANEILAGQAALYRRGKDHQHVAGKLRAATMRRIRPMLGVTADTTPDRLVAAVAARTGADPNLIGSALFGPVPDAPTLELVATQLHWIETEVG
ncbi:DUF4129 domain-containing protein [Nocardia arthritidis]|uniref:DUF4129 domain-containing protein n=1 Tax=Nocardia arthritidis TaxID=228602 RepID=A0A6G9Y453_9NOCA|nr:DUF4129 domain-containing protein [Nocardia arthritidis]QIS07998.1 DUF4129 domain-containing protein [Nocardia arthritidis]